MQSLDRALHTAAAHAHIHKLIPCENIVMMSLNQIREAVETISLIPARPFVGMEHLGSPRIEEYTRHAGRAYRHTDDAVQSVRLGAQSIAHIFETARSQHPQRIFVVGVSRSKEYIGIYTMRFENLASLTYHLQLLVICAPRELGVATLHRHAAHMAIKQMPVSVHGNGISPILKLPDELPKVTTAAAYPQVGILAVGNDSQQRFNVVSIHLFHRHTELSVIHCRT